VVRGGLPLFVAAGNTRRDACSESPGAAPLAYTVMATAESGLIAAYSNFGRCCQIGAPGDSITAAGSGSPTATAVDSGTSMAAPHVTGVAAKILSAAPEMMEPQVCESVCQGPAK
jgi:serine protease